MARNKLADLNDHLFAQLERLDDPECDLEKEIEKSKAVTQVASQIIKVNSLSIAAMRLVAGGAISMNDLPENLSIKKLNA